MSKPRDIFRSRAKERRQRFERKAARHEPSKADRKVASLWGLIGSLFGR